MPLRAVTLDRWQTLLFDSPEIEARRNAIRVQETARMLRGFGLVQSAERLTEAFEQALALWTDTRRLGVELSLRQKLVTFLGAANPTLLHALGPRQLEELSMVFSRAFFEAPPTVAPGAPELVRGL